MCTPLPGRALCMPTRWCTRCRLPSAPSAVCRLRPLPSAARMPSCVATLSLSEGRAASQVGLDWRAVESPAELHGFRKLCRRLAAMAPLPPDDSDEDDETLPGLGPAVGLKLNAVRLGPASLRVLLEIEPLNMSLARLEIKDNPGLGGELQRINLGEGNWAFDFTAGLPKGRGTSRAFGLRPACRRRGQAGPRDSTRDWGVPEAVFPGGRAGPVRHGLAPAVPMDNPYCSCKLTRVRYSEPKHRAVEFHAHGPVEEHAALRAEVVGRQKAEVEQLEQQHGGDGGAAAAKLELASKHAEELHGRDEVEAAEMEATKSGDLSGMGLEDADAALICGLLCHRLTCRLTALDLSANPTLSPVGRLLLATQGLPARQTLQALTLDIGAWFGTPIRETSCCRHPLTGAPYLRPRTTQARSELSGWMPRR